MANFAGGGVFQTIELHGFEYVLIKLDGAGGVAHGEVRADLGCHENFLFTLRIVM
jgi:hypothetical protein